MNNQERKTESCGIVFKYKARSGNIIKTRCNYPNECKWEILDATTGIEILNIQGFCTKNLQRKWRDSFES